MNSSESIEHLRDDSCEVKRLKRSGCTPSRLCIRCSMIKVIGYRFAVFERTFGRTPGPSEPLFFVRHGSRPVEAPEDDLRRQLSQAARDTHVSLPQILKFLGLANLSSSVQLRLVK